MHNKDKLIHDILLLLVLVMGVSVFSGCASVLKKLDEWDCKYACKHLNMNKWRKVNGECQCTIKDWGDCRWQNTEAENSSKQKIKKIHPNDFKVSTMPIGL